MSAPLTQAQVDSVVRGYREGRAGVLLTSLPAGMPVHYFTGWMAGSIDTDNERRAAAPLEPVPA